MFQVVKPHTVRWSTKKTTEGEPNDKPEECVKTSEPPAASKKSSDPGTKGDKKCKLTGESRTSTEAGTESKGPSTSGGSVKVTREAILEKCKTIPTKSKYLLKKLLRVADPLIKLKKVRTWYFLWYL